MHVNRRIRPAHMTLMEKINPDAAITKPSAERSAESYFVVTLTRRTISGRSESQLVIDPNLQRGEDVTKIGLVPGYPLSKWRPTD